MQRNRSFAGGGWPMSAAHLYMALDLPPIQ